MKTMRMLIVAGVLLSGVSLAAAADFDPIITMPGAGTMLREGEFEVLATAKQTGGSSAW